MKLKKCKYCKTEFTPYTSLDKFCKSSECVRLFVAETKAKEWKKRKRIIAEKIKPVSQMLKETQVTFNAYIRARDFKKKCCSCEVILTGKFDAGHFYSTKHKAVTFDERNVNGQCVTCNQFLHGNLLEYRTRLEKRIGKENLEDLQKKSLEVKKYTKEELTEIKDYYKKKLKEMLGN